MYGSLGLRMLTHGGQDKMAAIFPMTQIAKFMGPTWGPPGSCGPQMGPMLAPWTLLSGDIFKFSWMKIYDFIELNWFHICVCTLMGGKTFDALENHHSSLKMHMFTRLVIFAFWSFLRPFLAAIKQIYEWFSLFVRPSVRMSLVCHTFLPEASFGIRVLSSPVSVCLSECPCVCVSITCLSAR